MQPMGGPRSGPHDADRGRPSRRWLAVLLALGLLVAGCASDSDGGSSFGGDDDDFFDDDDRQDEQPDVSLPVEVGQAVAAVNGACSAMAREAAVLATDVAEGHVDTESEWLRLVEAKDDYENSAVAVARWTDGIVAAITAGAAPSELENWLRDLPFDDSDDGDVSTLELLHHQLQSGELEPERFDGGNDGQPSQTAQLAVLRVAIPLIARYGPAIVGIADTIIRLTWDWQDRDQAEEQALRRRLAQAFEGIRCDDEWPSDIVRPAVLWSRETCAPIGTPANIHSTGSGGPMFDANAPDESSVVAVTARHGSLVDAIGLDYASGSNRVELPVNGGGGGGVDVFDLRQGESISAIEVHAGAFVNAVMIETDTGRRHWFGNPDPTNASKVPVRKRYAVPSGGTFAGLQGQTAVFRPSDGSVAVNAVGCTYRPNR